jgi:hypothetical protein
MSADRRNIRFRRGFAGAVRLLIPALVSAAVGSWSAGTARAQARDIILGCEGEGCGCTDDTRSSAAFVLYRELDDKAAPLGRYPKGTRSKAGLVFSVIDVPGEYVVDEVKKASLPVRKGDRLHTLFYLGEGEWRAKLAGRTVEFSEGDIVTRAITPSRYTVWIQISVGSVHGYAKTFPYRGCLS